MTTLRRQYMSNLLFFDIKSYPFHKPCALCGYARVVNSLHDSLYRHNPPGF
jgi:hypothetical protein